MNPACVRFGALALALLCFPLVAGAQAGDTCEWAYCYSYGYYDSGSATVYGASVVDADGFYVDVDAAVIGPYNGIYDEAEAGDWCTAEADVSAEVSDGLYFIDAWNYVDYDCDGESWSDWISAGAQAYLTGIYPDELDCGDHSKLHYLRWRLRQFPIDHRHPGRSYSSVLRRQLRRQRYVHPGLGGFKRRIGGNRYNRCFE